MTLAQKWQIGCKCCQCLYPFGGPGPHPSLASWQLVVAGVGGNPITQCGAQWNNTYLLDWQISSNACSNAPNHVYRWSASPKQISFNLGCLRSFVADGFECKTSLTFSHQSLPQFYAFQVVWNPDLSIWQGGGGQCDLSAATFSLTRIDP